KEILDRARSKRILVIGDLMLDEFVWGKVKRISPEAPVPVVDIRRESIHLGGAANVLANLTNLGASARVVGVVGRDHASERLLQELNKSSANQASDSLIVDGERPTTVKTRIIAHNQLVVRADREKRAPIDARTEERMIAVLLDAIKDAAAFVVSDYDKGAVTPRVLREVLPAAYKRRIPVLVDPKIRNFDSYRPATLITPNHHEALKLTNTEEDTDEGLKVAAHLIRGRLDCDAVLITRGERGLMLLESYHEPVYVETVAREVYDVTGAGDTVIATLAGALSTGATMLEAAILANHAAGIVVGKVGTATASAEELADSFSKQF
ncbi:MAG TPA: D-glycero-beta-D-manno-heptose-7-phosphate kinase, partial [Pyrinomonadaceae bacterium]|nr:D-glycero-beta-D-manno-heptose-7-phosphate kinase [Pyrinomonadaceae bacterium]